MDCSLPVSSFHGIEYWSGLPCPPPGDLPDPGTRTYTIKQVKQNGRLVLVRMWRNWSLTFPVGNVKMMQPLWKTVWWFLKNLKIESPYNPAVLLLCVFPKELKARTQTDTCSLLLIAVLCLIAKCPSADEWINQIRFVHTVEYYSALQWMNGTCYNMDEPWGLSEISQTQKRDKYYVTVLMWDT